jgi:hypothetical protein
VTASGPSLPAIDRGVAKGASSLEDLDLVFDEGDLPAGVGREIGLISAFLRRYGASLKDVPWKLRTDHSQRCASRIGQRRCNCDVRVWLFEPSRRRRILLRLAP